jgi:hypothetical protein
MTKAPVLPAADAAARARRTGSGRAHPRRATDTGATRIPGGASMRTNPPRIAGRCQTTALVTPRFTPRRVPSVKARPR